VPPDRASFFEPAVDEGPTPSSPASRAYPIYNPPAETESWTPAAEPTPSIEIAPVASAQPAPTPIKLQSASPPSSIRVKDAPAPESAGPRADSRREPVDLTAVGSYEPFSAPRESPPIPWKLIAAGVVLIVGAFAVTQGYLPSEIPTPTLGRKGPAPEVKKAPAPPPVPTGAGRVAITTDPAGMRVLVDGKFVGTSPVNVDTLPPGRHVLTLQGAGGSIKRTIRVEAGKTLTLDFPVFSGFVAISAPFIIEVAENGKTIGTSDGPIILGPGHHQLHLQNKDLNYSATQSVDIEPGETSQVPLDPRGSANINAAPWAEVFIDGDRAGDTPLANVSIRLGVREIVFKNPQFPERKVVTTIKAGAPATIAVDFTKDK
jgi:hypothetical protein